MLAVECRGVAICVVFFGGGACFDSLLGGFLSRLRVSIHFLRPSSKKLGQYFKINFRTLSNLMTIVNKPKYWTLVPNSFAGNSSARSISLPSSQSISLTVLRSLVFRDFHLKGDFPSKLCVHFLSSR